MMDRPLVSICIPCFNARDTIARAIASARAQDWPNFEIIVCDDASKDGSFDIAASAIAGEPRARLVAQERNLGPGASRARLVAEARGDFVCFFDDDDESLPGRVAAQVTRIEAYERETGAALVACHAAGERRYANGYVLPLPAIGAAPVVPHSEAVADYLLFYRRIGGWCYGGGVPAASFMARRSVIEAVGGFDPELRRVEDVDFAIRLALAGGHFVGTSEALFVQYSTAGSDKSAERNLEAEVLLAERHAAYLKSRGRYYYAAHWPKLRYWHFHRRYDRFALELAGLVAHHPVAVAEHLFTTGPARLAHEWRIRGKQAQ